MIGTLLALVNTVVLLVIVSLPLKSDKKKGTEVVLDMNIFTTVYYVIEQVSRNFLANLRVKWLLVKFLVLGVPKLPPISGAPPLPQYK